MGSHSNSRGGNQPGQGKPNFLGLIANQIEEVAKWNYVRPIVIGHAATQIAVMKPDSMRFSYDEYLEGLEDSTDITSEKQSKEE